MRFTLFSVVLLARAWAQMPDVGYDPAAPLAVEEKTVQSYRDARLLDVSFASPRGGRVLAYVVVPSRKAVAGIVWQHWGMGDRSTNLPEAFALAKFGAISILLNAPFVGAKPVSKPEEELARWLQSVVEIRRAVDLLVKQYGVPESNLAYAGHSYGATLGGLVGVSERRFKALLLMGGHGSLSRAMESAGSPSAAMMSVINAERYAPRLAPAAIFLQYARYDRFVPKEQADRYVAAASEPKQVRWYECGHEFNDPKSFEDRVGWLMMQLKIKR